MSDTLDAATQAATDALDAAEDAERFGYDKRDVLLARLVVAVERLAGALEHGRDVTGGDA